MLRITGSGKPAVAALNCLRCRFEKSTGPNIRPNLKENKNNEHKCHRNPLSEHGSYVFHLHDHAKVPGREAQARTSRRQARTLGRAAEEPRVAALRPGAGYRQTCRPCGSGGIIYYFNPGLFGHRVFAADAVLKGNDIVNPVNTAWTLIAAFLVFGMQVGFTMLEAGFCRSRETVNVLMECIVDTCLCGILFYAIGFAFMFSHGNGFIGYHWFFLQGAPDTYETTGVAFLALWIFQFAFADTCSTITSGAMIGRTAFVGDLIY